MIKLKCETCKKDFMVKKYRAKTARFCSCICAANRKNKNTVWNKGLPGPKGKNAPAWKGGKFESGGYVSVYSPYHPRVKNNIRPYVFEHILVAEKKLGRYLLKNEVVHHVNGIKNDNRPENLVVMTRGKHLLAHNPLQHRPDNWSLNRKCKADGCSEKHFGLGYCRKHYKRFKRLKLKG